MFWNIFKSKVTDEQIKKVVDPILRAVRNIAIATAYTKGLTMREVGAQFGLTATQVSNILRRFGHKGHCQRKDSPGQR